MRKFYGTRQAFPRTALNPEVASVSIAGTVPSQEG
jgi:hypothetical protein